MKDTAIQIVVLLAALALLPAPGLCQSEADGIQLFREAFALYNKAQSPADTQRAMDKYEQALRIFERAGFKKGIGWVVNNMACICQESGKYDRAMELYEKSLDICLGLKDRAGEGRTLNNMANVYLPWGKYDEALELYEKSLTISRELKDRAKEGGTLNNMGLVYTEWGKYDKAMELYEESLAIRRELKDKVGEGRTLINIGEVLQYRGEHDKAREYFQQGLAIWTDIKVPTRWPKALIADTYMDTGDLAKAEPLVRDSNYSKSWARFYLLKRDFAKAGQQYEKILSSGKKNRNVENLLTGHTGLGKVSEAQEEYEKAAEHYEKAMQLVEEMRSSLVPAQRVNFFAVRVNGFLRSEPAAGLTRVRMKLGKDMASIDASELTRARAFADGLAQRSAKGVPDSVLKEEEQLVIRIAVLKKNRSNTPEQTKPDVYDNLTRQINAVEKEHKEFVEMLRKKYPSYAAVKYPQPVRPKNSALKPEECVVLFDVSGEGVCVKLIRGKKTVQSFYTDWPGADLQAKVRRFRRAFDDLKPREFDPALGQMLYQRLLLPVLVQVPDGTPLIIIPQGVLSILSFEALVVNGTATWTSGPNGDYPTGITYLGDKHPISYYQSINALHLARTIEAKKPTGDRSLIVADPVFDTSDTRARKQTDRKLAAQWRDLPGHLMSFEKQTGLSFRRLKLTENLATALKQQNPSRTDTLLGMDATKANLMKMKQRLDRYRNIIFATHGYFGTDLPGIQEPVLALTLVNQGKEDEGFLRMSEVTGLSLNADVVALTACQSGLGRNLSGEGVMSMGRAFQYAGARSVLMSLWAVDEQASVNLIEAFFKYLKAGKSKLEALNLARAQIRKDGYENPYFWAPFILVGETQ